MESPENEPPTAGEAYAARLDRLGSKRWKRWLGVQVPYRWNIRRRLHGRTLDVGCGTGRHLAHLSDDSVGVDHNPFSIAACREQGLTAYTVEEFFADPAASAQGSYDSLLAAHLIEHLEYEQARTILASYVPLVRPGGTILLITPQERGYASDATHVAFTDFTALRSISADLGLEEITQYSFPLPRAAGRVFTHNEYNHVARRPA